MLKIIYEMQKSNLTITGNIIYDLLIGVVIFKIIDSIVYNFVGDLYRLNLIDGRSSGSIINFSIKIAITLVIMGIIKLSMWIYHG